MTAIAAAQFEEAVRQDAAPHEGVELVLDEPRQFGAGAGLGVSDEAGRVLLMKCEVLRLGSYELEFFISQMPELTAMADRVLDR